MDGSLAQTSAWILAHTLRISDDQDWRVRTAEGAPAAMLPTKELLGTILSMHQGHITPMEAGTAAAPPDDEETGQPVALKDGEVVKCIHATCHKACKSVLDTWWHGECNTWQRERILLAVPSVDGPLWLYAIGRADLCEWLMPADAMDVDEVPPPSKVTRPRDEEDDTGPRKVPRGIESSPQQALAARGLGILKDVNDYTSLVLANYGPGDLRRRRLLPSEMATVYNRAYFYAQLAPVLPVIEQCGADDHRPGFVFDEKHDVGTVAAVLHEHVLDDADSAALLVHPEPLPNIFPDDEELPSLQGTGPVDDSFFTL